MNPIEELRRARPAHLGETTVDERTRSAELGYAMAQPREAGRARRTMIRPAWGLGLAGAAAAVTAIALLVSGTGTAPRAPAVAQGTPSPVASPKLVLSARQVLLAAATTTAREPAGQGAYWQTVVFHSGVSQAKGYTVTTGRRVESWVPAKPGAQAWERSQELGAKPTTPDDEKAWRAAGSPTKITISEGGKPFEVPTAAGKVETRRWPLPDGDKVYWLGRNVSMKDLRGLPAEPDALKRWLLSSYKGTATETNEPMGRDEWLFSVAANIVIEMPVTPDVRAATFRMLSELPSIKSLGEVTDAEGRTGPAVGLEITTRDDGPMLHRLIIDAETGRGLASDVVVVSPDFSAAPGLTPGSIRFSTVVKEAGWTDESPAK
ncbi:CU044_5270 family protein [Rhizohabitans arisaemae]|uniref:CU044_5270 family protein n=1 Tax=Rhizohabitans arisaemae TaxID=2720610 RepID=UPI0024B1CA34|nr:CU044_5270 family protein [Rhizohabitans arisaemae]